jgi:hypothetical protein
LLPLLTPLVAATEILWYGWQISIAAMLRLWEDLSKSRFHYLITNRLNQDCLDNFFSIVRQSVGARDNPTPEQFGHAYKQCLIESARNLQKPPTVSLMMTTVWLLLTNYPICFESQH